MSSKLQLKRYDMWMAEDGINPRESSRGAYVLAHEALAEIERLTAALERVLHYWQERYGMKFEKTDEVLIDEVRRVQKALQPAAPEPRDG